jgi:hypothetical protein
VHCLFGRRLWQEDAKVGGGNGLPGLKPPKRGCNDKNLALFTVEVLRTHPAVLAADENQRAFLADLAVMIVRKVVRDEQRDSDRQKTPEAKKARKQAAQEKPAKRRRRGQPSSGDEEEDSDE